VRGLMKIIISLLTFMSCSPVMAQSSAEPSGDTIIVTGQGLAAPIGIDAYDSVVIPRERLVLNASGRIENILSDAAGFQQFRRTDSRSANPTSQGATLRALGGNASSRALVLLDGVPQADPFTGYIPYSALRPERLASARITRGGGAGAFGVGAVAGTIELASGGPDDLPDATLRAFAGSRNATDVSGGIVKNLGSGFVTLNAGWDRGDGYILIPKDQRGVADIPAHYDAWSAAVRGVAPVTTEMEIQANVLVFDDRRLRGLTGTASRSRGVDASIRLVGHGAWGFEALAYIQERGFRAGFVSTAADRSSTTTTLDQFATPSIGLGAKIEVRPPVGDTYALRLGADMRKSSGRTNEFFRYVAGSPTRIRRAGGENVTFGTFIEGSAKFEALTLTGGARLDNWSIKSGFIKEQPTGTGAPTLNLVFADRVGTRPTFRGGALLAITDSVDVRAAAYSGFRVPTLNELYRPFRVGADATAANAALRLERLKGAEAGLDFRVANSATINVTAFWNQLDGAIANVTLGTGPAVFPQVGFVAAGGVFRQRLNVDAIRVKGLEVTANVPVGDFTMSASYAYIHARVRASGLALPLNGKRPAQTPKHQASTTFAYAPFDGPNASITVRYAGPQFEDDLQTRQLPRAVTVDGVASIGLFADVRLVVRAENILNEKIVSGISSTGIQDIATPRTLWLGLTFAR
jgi:vitamin B12 transporter